jgi:hypothetical protein
MISNNTGSRLLQKLTRTLCEEFNQKIFNLLDLIKTMEYKYKMLTLAKLLQDPDYHKLGPIGLILTLHEIYGVSLQIRTGLPWLQSFLKVTTYLLSIVLLPLIAVLSKLPPSKYAFDRKKWVCYHLFLLWGTPSYSKLSHSRSRLHLQHPVCPSTASCLSANSQQK